MLSVILPTIAGREGRYDATRAAYARTLAGVDHEIITVRNCATAGEAWNLGAQAAKGSTLHFAVDDAEPHPGWYDAALDALHNEPEWFLPSPRLVFPDGWLEGCGTLGAGMFLPECETGTPCRSAGIPTIPRSVWERVGEFLPIHYYTDDDWFHRAACLGYRCAVHRGYAFTHHHHKDAARTRMQAASAAHRAEFLRNAARLSVGVAPCV